MGFCLCPGATARSRSLGRSPDSDAAASSSITKGNDEIGRRVQPHRWHCPRGSAPAGCRQLQPPEAAASRRSRSTSRYPERTLAHASPAPADLGRRRSAAPADNQSIGADTAGWFATLVVLLLVPADPLRPRRADDHFAAEAAAARDADIAVALLDHDSLADPGGAQRAVARVPDAGGAAVYRGRMMSSASYAALAEALSARGVTLRTGAAQYRRAHELPGWHQALAAVTPQAAWTQGAAPTTSTDQRSTSLQPGGPVPVTCPIGQSSRVSHGHSGTRAIPAHLRTRRSARGPADDLRSSRSSYASLALPDQAVPTHRCLQIFERVHRDDGRRAVSAQRAQFGVENLPVFGLALTARPRRAGATVGSRGGVLQLSAAHTFTTTLPCRVTLSRPS
jgi:hypothetical protein